MLAQSTVGDALCEGHFTRSKSVWGFFGTKLFYRFLMDFSWKRKDFCHKFTKISGRGMSLGSLDVR